MIYEDRVSTHPNRMLIKPVDGSAEILADLELADEPINEGDFVSYGNMKDYLAGIGTTTGTGKNLVLTLPRFALLDGATLRIKLHTNLQDGVTLNVNGIGAKPLLNTQNIAVRGSNYKTNSYITITYNGVGYIVNNVSDGILPYTEVWFYNSDTFNPNTYGLNVGDVINIDAVGGGGAGGGDSGKSTQVSSNGGGGGGAGAYVKTSFTLSNLNKIPITIGSGGIGVSGNSGGNGGTTSVGAIVSAGGGGGGGVGTYSGSYGGSGGYAGNSSVGSGGRGETFGAGGGGGWIPDVGSGGSGGNYYVIGSGIAGGSGSGITSSTTYGGAQNSNGKGALSDHVGKTPTSSAGGGGGGGGYGGGGGGSNHSSNAGGNGGKGAVRISWGVK